MLHCITIEHRATVMSRADVLVQKVESLEYGVLTHGHAPAVGSVVDNEAQEMDAGAEEMTLFQKRMMTAR